LGTGLKAAPVRAGSSNFKPYYPFIQQPETYLMRTAQQEIDERTRLAGNNQFELLLFRLGGGTRHGQRELFGINVFKVREVLVMPAITELANAHEHLMGVANIRGQIIPVINLPAVVGCKPTKRHDHFDGDRVWPHGSGVCRGRCA
jgi:hypothetical protein